MKKHLRIEAAQDTLKYLKEGYYIIYEKRIDISATHKKSVEESIIKKGRFGISTKINEDKDAKGFSALCS